MLENTFSADGGAVSASAVMSLAWSIFRTTWANPVKFNTLGGRRRWSWSLSQAWASHKDAIARAAAPVVMKPDPIEALEREDALLDYAESFSLITIRRTEIRAELAQVTL